MLPAPAPGWGETGLERDIKEGTEHTVGEGVCACVWVCLQVGVSLHTWSCRCVCRSDARVGAGTEVLSCAGDFQETQGP